MKTKAKIKARTGNRKPRTELSFKTEKDRKTFLKNKETIFKQLNIK